MTRAALLHALQHVGADRGIMHVCSNTHALVKVLDGTVGKCMA